MAGAGFTLVFTMESDWALSAGKGRQGGIDSLIMRDQDGLPYLPVTTIRGVWRDAAEQLAFALDDGAENGPWRETVDRLFGSQPAHDARGADSKPPLPSLIWPSPARFCEAVRIRLVGNDRHDLRRAMGFIKPGVAINPATESARTRFLRFEEVARSGAIVSSQVSVGSADETELAFLVCAGAMITSIGGNRRRGLGRCSVAVQNIEPAAFASVAEAAQLLENAKPSETAEKKTDNERAYGFAQAGVGHDFVSYSIAVDLESPLVVADQVLGNTTTTHDYIPGTCLLPAITNWLSDADGASRANVMRAIANGDIRVLPAYLSHNGQRLLPTPTAWRQLKDDTSGPDGKGAIRNDFAPGSNTAGDRTGAWKPLRKGYCLRRDGAWPLLCEPKRSVFTHNTIADFQQTPTSDVGGVYTYEALSAGQTFIFEVWVRETLGLVPCPLDGKARLARAKTAGYGLVRMKTLAGPMPVARQARLTNENIALVHFETDCVLADADSPLEAIKSAFDEHGVTVKAVSASEDTEDADEARSAGELRVTRIDGWVGAWMQPRPTLMAIKAGSSVQLKIEAGQNHLDRVCREGLGRRRGEGFGQISIGGELLWQPIEQQQALEAPDEPGEGQGGQIDLPPLSEADKAYLENIEKAALMEAIRNAAELVDRTARLGWKGNEPNMSQIGSLRQAMGELRGAEAMTRMATFVERMKSAKKWPGDSADKLRNLFESPDTVWGWLEGIDWSALLVVREKDNVCKGDSEFTRYAIRSVLAACMRAHKRDLEKTSSNETSRDKEPA